MQPCVQLHRQRRRKEAISVEVELVVVQVYLGLYWSNYLPIFHIFIGVGFVKGLKSGYQRRYWIGPDSLRSELLICLWSLVWWTSSSKIGSNTWRHGPRPVRVDYCRRVSNIPWRCTDDSFKWWGLETCGTIHWKFRFAVPPAAAPNVVSWQLTPVPPRLPPHTPGAGEI